MGYKPSDIKRIRNYKSQSSYWNFYKSNGIDTLLTSDGFNKHELNIALDAIKNAKKVY